MGFSAGIGTARLSIGAGTLAGLSVIIGPSSARIVAYAKEAPKGKTSVDAADILRRRIVVPSAKSRPSCGHLCHHRHPAGLPDVSESVECSWLSTRRSCQCLASDSLS